MPTYMYTLIEKTTTIVDHADHHVTQIVWFICQFIYTPHWARIMPCWTMAASFCLSRCYLNLLAWFSSKQNWIPNKIFASFVVAAKFSAARIGKKWPQLTAAKCRQGILDWSYELFERFMMQTETRKTTNTKKYSILQKKFQLILFLIFITHYFSNKKYHSYYMLFIY
jgi:hypothetical protein